MLHTSRRGRWVEVTCRVTGRGCVCTWLAQPLVTCFGYRGLKYCAHLVRPLFLTSKIIFNFGHVPHGLLNFLIVLRHLCATSYVYSVPET